MGGLRLPLILLLLSPSFVGAHPDDSFIYDSRREEALQKADEDVRRRAAEFEANFKQHIRECLEGKRETHQLADEVFSEETTRSIESRIAMVVGQVQEFSKPVDGVSKLSDPINYNRLLKLQDAIDERLIGFRLKQRAYGSKARWWGVGIGFGAGLLATAVGSRMIEKGPGDFIGKSALFAIATTVGTGGGLAVGELIARSQSQVKWSDLVPTNSSAVTSTDSSEYTDLGGAVRSYISGSDDGETVADALVQDPSSFESKTKFVYDEIAAASSDITRRELLLYQLKHKILLKVSKHNEEVFARQDRNRTYATVGGAAVGALTAFVIVPRLIGEGGWQQAGRFGLVLSPIFMVAGASVANLAVPPIEQSMNRPAIRTVTNLD